MTTTKSKSDTSALQIALKSATKAREEAEASHAEAIEALKTATSNHQDTIQAAAKGEADAQALALTTAELDVARLRLQHIADEVEAAHNAERVAIAHDAVAHLRPDVLDLRRDQELSKVSTTLAGAIVGAVEKAKSIAETHNEKVRTAAATARAAGLKAGECDPALPVVVGRDGTLYVTGQPLRPVVVADVIDRAIRSALTAAGVK